MAKLAAVRHVYCQKCGRVSHYVGESIDPRWPLVLCSYTTMDGKAAGCGHQLGTNTPEEATSLIRVRMVADATASHRGGHKRPGTRDLCTICHPPDDPAHAAAA